MNAPSLQAVDTSQGASTVHALSGAFLLEELRRSALIQPRVWDSLPQAVQGTLTSSGDLPGLVGRLIEHRLLTEYQASRIRGGCLDELIVGNYRILDFLGAGSMGNVFKAEHVRLRRPVALKIVTLSGAENPQVLERFFSEMQITAQLQHPNIASAIDAGEVPGDGALRASQHYLVMEYVPGHDLEAYVKMRGPLEPAQACDIIFQVAGALEEAHRFGLVHRDIKPANIRVTPDGRVKLLDFGIAKDANRRLTAAGAILGSLAFLAPEQAQDASAVDIRADIYALGGTLFWCLTGQFPFLMTSNLLADFARRVHQRPPSVRSLRPEIPDALEALIAKMLAPSPQDRHADPTRVMKALVPFLKPSGRGLGGPLIGSFLENSVSALESSPQAEGSKTHRVLIVDDEPQNRVLFQLMLAAPDFTLQEASDGAQAVALLARVPCDLVLLDIDMPRMNGVEVVRFLREQPPCPHLKIIMISGRASPDAMARMMLAGADDFLAKPFTATQLEARVRTALRWKDAQDRAVHMQRQLLSVNHELEQNLQARASDLIGARNGLVMALAELVAYRDNETGAHLRRLQQYCRCLAEHAARTPSFAAAIDENFIHLVECCAPLHDIGKGAMPDHILLKPGKLTSEEFAVMQTHTTLGADLLRKVAKQGFARPFLQMAIDITRHHHERFDGRGYPDRLTGEDIPLAARILALADAYDALRSRRVYKPALPHADAVRIMVEQSPGHFDPALLQVFAACADEFERIFRVAVD